MTTFNQNLEVFLTGCKENALRELEHYGEYNEWKTAQADLRSRLETLLNPEAQKLLNEYVEATTDVQRMEADKIFLFGLTVSAEIQKRFDASTDEYKAFEGEYL